MKRRTNIFYKTGDDSKFITFSNYTEDLTGAFLSTDTKLYPSKFLCAYINNLDTDTDKLNFINYYLIGNYENKMAYFRDNEKTIYSLNALIDCIKKYDANLEINYYGDIVEHDYNGSFTDTICTITSGSDNKHCVILTNSSPSTTIYNTGSNYLYGWEDGNMPTEYQTINPNNYTDQTEKYFSTYNYYLKAEEQVAANVRFNTVIPLYDCINKQDVYNYNEIRNFLDENESAAIDNSYIISERKKLTVNAPLGIWFAGEPITLKYDSTTGFGSSWSLLVASLFKPFPASQYMPSEEQQTSIGNQYNTFAEALVQNNKFSYLISYYSYLINTLVNRINDLESKINKYSTYYQFEEINRRLSYLESILGVEEGDTLYGTSSMPVEFI